MIQVVNDWKLIHQDRRMGFMDMIEKHGSIGRAKLQNQLGWGDGIFERTKRDVLELYPEDVNYNKKTKLFTIIKPEQEFFMEVKN